MIEFFGELSVQCKDYILKRESRVGVIATSIVATIFLIPILIATFLWNWIAIIAFIPFVMLISFAFVRPSKKSYGIIMPKRIIVKRDVIVSEGEKFYFERPVSEVKKVVDMGDWYHIYFNYRYRNPRFVCQKDLITQGTLVDFENLFENKIVRNVK